MSGVARKRLIFTTPDVSRIAKGQSKEHVSTMLLKGCNVAHTCLQQAFVVAEEMYSCLEYEGHVTSVKN